MAQQKKKKVTRRAPVRLVKDTSELDALKAQLAALTAKLGEAKPAPPVAVDDPSLVKLDLACGETPRAGYQSVDFYAPSAQHKVDLTSGEKWPFEDSSVDAIHCSHFIEHIEKGNKHKTYTEQGNLFLFFFQECYRILKDGASIELQWPALQSVRAFQDPTHCDFIPLERMNYLSKGWRDANRLDHYLTRGVPLDLVAISGAPTITEADSLRAEEVQKENFKDHWNFAQDLVCTLKCVKPSPTA